MTDRELLEQMVKDVADIKEEVKLISKVVTASRSDILSLCISKIAEKGMVFDPRVRYEEERQCSNEYLKCRSDLTDEKIDQIYDRIRDMERTINKC